MEQYFNFAMILLCLVIWGAVLIQRRIFEACLAYFKINIKSAKLWRSVFLPISGPGTGILLAVFVPLELPTSYTGLWGRIFAGIVCGLFSSKVYQIVKQYLTTKVAQFTQKTETKVVVTATKTNTVTENEVETPKEEENTEPTSE